MISDLSLLSVDIFCRNYFFQYTYICTKQTDSPSDIDPSWSSLEELGSFEDFTAFYIKIDNADPMLLYPDQTPAKYLHLSCIFLPVMALAPSCGLSDSLISSHVPDSSPSFAPRKTIHILCDKHISVNFPGYCRLVWQATD